MCKDGACGHTMEDEDGKGITNEEFAKDFAEMTGISYEMALKGYGMAEDAYKTTMTTVSETFEGVTEDVSTRVVAFAILASFFQDWAEIKGPQAVRGVKLIAMKESADKIKAGGELTPEERRRMSSSIVMAMFEGVIDPKEVFGAIAKDKAMAEGKTPN